MINSIRFYLRKSKMQKDQMFHVAQVVTRGTYTENDLVRDIVNTGTTLTPTDVSAVMDLFNTLVSTRLEEGFTIVTRFANFRISIKGKFESEDDAFDSSRHTLVARVNPGASLKKRLENALHVEKISQIKTRADLKAFRDLRTKTENQIATPDGNASLIGNGLDFDGENPDQGIFFKDEDGNLEKVSEYIETSSKKILFRLPMLRADSVYVLELHKSYNGGGVIAFPMDFSLSTAAPTAAGAAASAENAA